MPILVEMVQDSENTTQQDGHQTYQIQPNQTIEQRQEINMQQQNKAYEYSGKPILRTSNQRIKQVQQLEPKWSGQSYGQCNIRLQCAETMEYNPKMAKVIAQTINELNQVLQRETKTAGLVSLAQTYSLNKGLKNLVTIVRTQQCLK